MKFECLEELIQLDEALIKLGKSDSSVEYALHIRDEFDKVIEKLNQLKTKMGYERFINLSDEYFKDEDYVIEGDREMNNSIYCNKTCKEYEFKTLGVLEYIHYCNKYNKKLKSEKLTDRDTMRDELCIYKCEECTFN